MAIQSGRGLEVLMEFLPEDYTKAWTLASSVSRSGIGLHSGDHCEITLLPSEKEGFYVSWVDRPADSIQLEPSQVRDSQLCTTLDFGHRTLSTVEHLLAAVECFG